MRQTSATECKTHFGKFLDIVKHELVLVRRKDQPVAVLMSWEEYQHLQALEGAYLIAKAKAAEQMAEKK